MIVHGKWVLAAAILASGVAPAQQPLTLREAPAPRHPEATVDAESVGRGGFKPTPCALPGTPRAYKLEAAEALDELVGALSRDPVATGPHADVFMVVLARPLPCDERLVSARLDLWDSMALTKRRATSRLIRGAAEFFRRKDPGLHGLLFPGAEQARAARSRYRLSRKVKFRPGSPWMTSINGHAALIFPLAAARASTASWHFRTERLVPVPGKKPRRVTTSRTEDSILLPGPEQPSHTLAAVLALLGLDPDPGPVERAAERRTREP